MVSVLGRSMSIDGDKEEKSKRGGNQDTRTPLEFFNKLDEQFQFDLDPCDSLEKPKWLGIEAYNLNNDQDGLELPWFGNVFVNPPWNDIQSWIDKAEKELEKENCRFVVFLVPSRVETRWFHHILESEYLMNHIFLKSRMQFDEKDNPYVIGISIFTFWRGIE